MRHTKFINRVLMMAMGIALFACVEPFTPDLSNSGYEELIVVEGHITNKPGPFRVKLTYSIPLDTIRLAEPVYGANVIIYSDNGNEYKLTHTTDGWYETKPQNLKAETGVNYSLFIETANGKQYESTPETMEPASDITNVRFEEFEKMNFDMIEPTNQKWLNILVNSKGESGKTSYLKWDYEETWQINIPYYVKIVDYYGNETFDYITPEVPFESCWATEKSSTITVGSSEGLDKNEIINIPVKSIGPYNTRLHVKYSILVKQYSINKEFFEYWSKLEEVNENSGSMFDTKPISIYGNISCCNDDSHALGYFMVSSLKEKRLFIKPDYHSVSTNSGFEGCYYLDFPLNSSYLYVGKKSLTNTSLFQDTFECTDCGDEGSKIKPTFWQ